MNITEQIKSHIRQIPEAKAFTAASLHHLASADTVRKVLGRLANAGEIERLSRGVFAKPMQTRFGAHLPSAKETMETIAKTTGETLATHGAEAIHLLHLSTQIPLRLFLYTSGKSRKIKIGNQIVTLQHISPRKMIAPNTPQGLVISALWYLGQKQVSVETIQNISSALPKEEFEKVLAYTEQMPAWMANCFYEYNHQKKAA